MTTVPASDALTIVTQIQVLQNGDPVATLGDIVPGGTVSLNATSENMRTCSFSCLDPDGTLTPNSAGGGVLQPTGVELAISSGYIVNDVPVVFPQGIFSVTGCSAATSTTAPGPVLSVTGTDRSLPISANTFRDSFSIAQGTPVQEAIHAIVQAQAPWLRAIDIAPTDYRVAAQLYSPGDDPFAEIQSVAAAGGMVAFFDAAGVLRVMNNPALGGSPISIALQDGPESLSTSVTTSTSTNPGYNGVIVVGTSATSGASVSGSAFDMDPSSPLYALGPYGFQPAPPVQLSSISSDAQATAAAQNLLPQVLGLTRTVVVDTVPAYFLDAYALAYLENKATQTAGIFVLQSATVPLDYSGIEAMTFVPLGTPLSQLTPATIQLGAGQGSTGYLYSGQGNTYAGWSAGGSTSTGGASLGGLGVIGGFGAPGGIGLFGRGGFWGGSRYFPTLFGGTGSTQADGEDG